MSNEPKRPAPGDTVLTAKDVLKRYREEELADFIGIPLEDVNQPGHFENRPIHTAVVRGDLDELRALIEGGADINAAGELGYTPCMKPCLWSTLRS